MIGKKLHSGRILFFRYVIFRAAVVDDDLDGRDALIGNRDLARRPLRLVIGNQRSDVGTRLVDRRDLKLTDVKRDDAVFVLLSVERGAEIACRAARLDPIGQSGAGADIERVVHRDVILAGGRALQ